MKVLLLPLLSAALLAGCPKAGVDAGTTPPVANASSPATPAASDLASQLTRYHWQLQGANNAQGQRIDALFMSYGTPLQLNFEDDRINILHSCNLLGGTYAVTGDAVTFSQMTSTKMACADPKLMALDGEISKRLEGPLSYTLAESEPPQLRLRNRAGDTLLFAGEPIAKADYDGPGQRVFLEVQAQTQPCHHPLIEDMQCLVTREVHYDAQGLKTGKPGEFGFFYDQIKGYTHVPGVRNVLRVNRYKLKNPPMDASNTAWVLDMVVESDTSAK